MELNESIMKRVLVTISKLITFLEAYIKEKGDNEKVTNIIKHLQEIKNLANE
jgi:hypothetical protein